MIIKNFTWPAELTLNLIGGKWKALILHHLLRGESRRFGELKRLLPGISAKMLAKHLKELEYDGLILRMETGEEKIRIVYAPTSRSRSLAPILDAIQAWGREHLEVYGKDGNAGRISKATGDLRGSGPIRNAADPEAGAGGLAEAQPGQAFGETRPLTPLRREPPLDMSRVLLDAALTS